MKKVKAIISILITLTILLSISVVYAHSVELDPNSLITFPSYINNGAGKITIKDTVTSYSLYYQAVEISDSVYSQIVGLQEDGEEEIASLEEELTTLRTECTDLQEIYQEKLAAYQALMQSDGPDLEQLALAQTAYQTAEQNYNDKVDEYNEKVENYQTRVEEINRSINVLVPTYVDANWKETEDGSFTIDSSYFTGKKAFAVWAKLVDSAATITYDEAIYTVQGAKVEDVKVQSVTLNKTEVSITKGSTYTLTATITPENATNKEVVWSSEDESIATVVNGKVTGVSEGKALITVTTKDGNHTATCEVTVTKSVETPANGNGNGNGNGKDNTVAPSTIPQTGITSSYIIISLIAVISIVGIIVYKRMKYFDFK